MVKNADWHEASQLAIYKRSRVVNLGATANKTSSWAERYSNPRHVHASSCEVDTVMNCNPQVLVANMQSFYIFFLINRNELPCRFFL